ncbi:ATP-binding cassette domain-containing protein [Treponema phagedenis]|uniref:ABC transporter, ATP-binding protein n=1 Tax=Treponema phagedenis TaxID=162 RepID=A0A0B7GRT7_TREPH|nr:ATP-binding cassette domain-containing protein [Treponema phagedenis]NVP24772.1 ATP-binding cassette domain-containing protein [Treponema phagedenis]QEJ95882.1 ATP-binding cassette domain-containing protein [Treponema phagedenis]QEJ98886.1 ATP-binding cassette domain-containing protein [Treponema phagedenis]QEK00420.1 ATP-binding cassette domain-containing protein [Treponema phagedenis]QEK04394.1 ATP-binding cassette domain-containing protein [Treponema phagedenis]
MAIEISIKKDYKNFSLDVSFKTKTKTLGILGHSGSGKSLTLKSIAGLIKPDKGYIKVSDRMLYNTDTNINIDSKDRGVGYMFQSLALFPHLTVEKNLTYFMKGKDKISTAHDLLKKFRVYHLKDRYPKDLSGGEKQRVALARIISTNPSIILLDEPFSALDTNLKWDMEQEIISFLKDFDIPRIIVTHNKNEAYRLSDEILILSNGKVVDFGSKNIIKHPKNIESAKILGHKNFSAVNLVDGMPTLVDYNINLSKNINTPCVSLRAECFYLDSIHDAFAVKGILKNLISDIEKLIGILSVNNKTILLEFNIHGDTLAYLNKNINKEIILYYKYDDLLFLDL